MAQRGGRRKGAGRKLAPEVHEFREWLRGKFNSAEGRRRIWGRIQRSDVLCVKALSLAFPTPLEVDLNINRIPEDFVFSCELTTRGGSPPPAPVALPARRRRVSRD